MSQNYFQDYSLQLFFKFVFWHILRYCNVCYPLPNIKSQLDKKSCVLIPSGSPPVFTVSYDPSDILINIVSFDNQL